MCKAPKAPKITVEKPEYLRNPFLDSGKGEGAALSALRSGTSALRIPLFTGLGIGFNPRGGSTGASGTAGPQGNASRQGSLGSSGGSAGSRTNIIPRGRPAPGGGGGGGGSREQNVNQVHR